MTPFDQYLYKAVLATVALIGWTMLLTSVVF